MGLANPKKDWWATRKAKGRWIRGEYFTAKQLIELRKKIVDDKEKQKEIKKRPALWQRIKNWFKNLWLRLRSQQFGKIGQESQKSITSKP